MSDLGLSDASELELLQALMTAIKRLEEAGGKTDDLREVANRVADPYPTEGFLEPAAKRATDGPTNEIAEGF